MKQFLIRLFNLEVFPDKECPSCSVYKKWTSQLEGEIVDLRNRLDTALQNSYEDKQAERAERQQLEDTILKYVRIKPGREPQQVPQPIQEPAKQVVRPGQSWSKIKTELEAAARKKADMYRIREDAVIKEGKLAPEEKQDAS